MIRLVFLAVVMFDASAAMAQTKTAPPSGGSSGTVSVSGARAAPTAGTDKMICAREEELGSRLKSRKVCMTASQWEEERRAARQEVDRAQIQRSYPL